MKFYSRNIAVGCSHNCTGCCRTYSVDAIEDVSALSFYLAPDRPQSQCSHFFLTLSGRSIIPPLDRDLWPAQQYLAEHRREWRL